jgi:hypothetical protein
METRRGRSFGAAMMLRVYSRGGAGVVSNGWGWGSEVMAPPTVHMNNTRTFRPDEMGQIDTRNAETAVSRIKRKIECFEKGIEMQCACYCYGVGAWEPDSERDGLSQKPRQCGLTNR